MIRIGFQGVDHSNSQEAAQNMAFRMGWNNVEYVPLVHSRGVVKALKAGTIDYGVMASCNMVCGLVQETELALENLDYRVLTRDVISIHHCLFTKNADVTQIGHVASHLQALKQCSKTIEKMWPGIDRIETEDTAIAAEMLHEGKLPEDTGVLCRREAGEALGLHLLKENVEDDRRNATEFICIQLEPTTKIAVVAGLGLIGGSMAKALKAYTDFKVYGYNRTRSVAEQALKDGAIDGIADDEIMAQADLVMPVLYPKATVDYLKRVIPLMKKGAMVCDLVGVKEYIIREIEPVAQAQGIRFVGGHPMAGLAKAGYSRSFAELFQGASMILVSTSVGTMEDIIKLRQLFLRVGFGKVKVCDAATHDRMIAHTSQLAHVVSNSYVKSKVSASYDGFAGGSYKDMTRIACLNEMVWSELFLLNKDALLSEIDNLIANMTQIRDALAAEDQETLELLLRKGREAKERIDRKNPNLPSD